MFEKKCIEQFQAQFQPKRVTQVKEEQPKFSRNFHF